MGCAFKTQMDTRVPNTGLPQPRDYSRLFRADVLGILSKRSNNTATGAKKTSKHCNSRCWIGWHPRHVLAGRPHFTGAMVKSAFAQMIVRELSTTSIGVMLECVPNQHATFHIDHRVPDTGLPQPRDYSRLFRADILGRLSKRNWTANARRWFTPTE